MEISLEGKVALVTGASRGIGRAIAQRYAEAGAAVLLSSRKQDALDAAVAEIAAAVPGSADRLVAFAANAGEPDQAAACIEACIERLGGIDILVNNAAANPYMGPTIDIDLPRHDKTWQVNFRGPLVWMQLAWHQHMKEHGGAVVNISSVGGISVEPSLGIYNATKAALIHLTRTMAAELGPGVRVNAIAPGLVKTDMAKVLVEHGGEALAQRLPLRRLGEPDDIANVALFLVSELSSWMTGQLLIVDGGLTVRG